MTKIDGVSAVAIVLIASFGVDRVTTAILFVLSLPRAWRRIFPDPGSCRPELALVAARQRRLAYICIATGIAIFVIAWYGNVCILAALGFQTKRYLDVLITGVIIVGVSEWIGRILGRGAQGGKVQAPPHPIEATGSLTLNGDVPRAMSATKESAGEAASRSTDSSVIGLEPPRADERQVDRVHFSISAPRNVRPGAVSELYTWAHVADQFATVLERVKLASGNEDVMVKRRGPTLVARGTLVSVQLKVQDDLELENDEDTLLWDGEIANTCFLIRAPEQAEIGEKKGVALFRVDGLQIARIFFTITVGFGEANHVLLRSRREHLQRAFASYASPDRNQVLARIQGIQKVAPTLHIFLDVLSLRSGQNWEEELWSLIPNNDVFYLFWSKNAKDSEWVEKEWRCALKTRGLSFIDPIPLIDPHKAPPPSELASKHFNDWVLAFME